MATYGLLDWDLTQWKQPIVFNLELMKKSVYYKNKKNLVKLIHEFDAEKYSHVIVQKDFEDGLYPKEIFLNPKTIAEGLVYSDGKYKPMPLEIERLVPDKTIYKDFSKYYQGSKRDKDIFEVLMHAQHARLSLDGETVWKDWEDQFDEEKRHLVHSIVMHDKDIVAIEGAHKACLHALSLFSKSIMRIGFKFPLEIKSDEDFLKWGSMEKLVNLSVMKLRKVFDDKLFIEAISKGGNQNFEYVLSFNDISKDDWAKIFRQMMFCSNKGMSFLLTIVDSDSIHPLWLEFVDTMNEYSLSLAKTKKDYALIYYLKHSSQKPIPDSERMFLFLQKENFDLFKLFYECKKVIIKDNEFASKWEWKYN